ncbi:hypothetical protein [Helicobacter rodentium]|nr:hypothetical protein [Helicobacter rodentium]
MRESETNEAIYNLINQKIFNGEIKKYRLPRMLRILAMTKWKF